LAERGVRVFVLPWSETKIVMNLGSARAKEHLEGLHENIFVLLHPLVSPVKWSHHQKIVVVDQDIAFVGGLDLAFGRYDDSSHQLRDDAAHSAFNSSMESAMPRWPGKDYYNPSVCPFEGAAEPWHDSVDRFLEPRMGWHDVHMSVDGLAARDVAFNFIQRWNHHKEVLLAPSRYPYLLPKLSAQQTNGTSRCQVLRSLSDWSGGLGILHEASIEAAYLKAISEAEHFVYIGTVLFPPATRSFG
jgi:phospholipase D1/2